MQRADSATAPMAVVIGIFFLTGWPHHGCSPETRAMTASTTITAERWASACHLRRFSKHLNGQLTIALYAINPGPSVQVGRDRC